MVLVLLRCLLDTASQKKLGSFAIQKELTFARTNETLSVCFGRVLVRLLLTGVELRICFGGPELESLRIVTGAILMSSSSEEVDSLSSSSGLLSWVAKWIGCGAAMGWVYEETD